VLFEETMQSIPSDEEKTNRKEKKQKELGPERHYRSLQEEPLLLALINARMILHISYTTFLVPQINTILDPTSILTFWGWLNK
jgi:hypothetical protein